MHFAVERTQGSVPPEPAAVEPQAIDQTLIDAQLTKILSSREFVRSDRMARFLRHVVYARVEQRAENAKERMIGIGVFDRAEDWDPKIDTIVRSEARRLRAKLELYYSTSTDDLVRFTLPKGGYYPEFELLQLAVEQPTTLPVEFESPAAAAPTKIPRHPQRFRLFFAVAMAAGAFVCWLLMRQQPLSRAEASAFEIVPFANEIGRELSPAISPDGKSVAYVWDGNTGNYDIYIKNAEGGPGTRPRRITQSAAAELNPAWSPDGRALAFIRVEAGAASLVTIDLITGDEHRLVSLRQHATGWADENGPFEDLGPSWTPDGRSIVFSDISGIVGRNYQQSHALYRVNIGEGSVQSILETARGMDFSPRVSPDGRRLAFARYTSHGISDLYLCNLDGSDLQPLTSEKRAITGIAWSAESNALYFTSWRHGTSRIRRIDIQPGSRAELLPDAMAATDVAIARDGGTIAFTSVAENWNIWRMSLEESDAAIALGTAQRFIASSGRNHGPSYSPDRKKLAFISNRSGSWQIWLADADGGNVRQLSQSDGGFLGSVNWSPDSKTIAFDARLTGNANIYLLDVASGGVPKPFAASRFEERMPSFSADGKSIYFNSNRDGGVAVWKARLADHFFERVGLPNSFKSLEAPVSRRLFFNVFETVYLSKPDGSDAVRLPVVDAYPDINWIPTDGAFYFTQQSEDGQIAFLAYHHGKVTLLKKFAGSLVQNTSNLAVSPDRRWLLYAQVDQSTSDILIRRPTKAAASN